MDHNVHPLESDEAMMLMHRFLADVILDYRENEIKDWLQGLLLDDIHAILNRPGNEDLLKNAFIVPFTFLHYAVVPHEKMVDALQGWLNIHPFIPNDNTILQKTKLNFDRIFKGKTSFIFDPNNGGHKSY
jgi:hypothetical protein